MMPKDILIDYLSLLFLTPIIIMVLLVNRIYVRNGTLVIRKFFFIFTKAELDIMEIKEINIESINQKKMLSLLPGYFLFSSTWPGMEFVLRGGEKVRVLSRYINTWGLRKTLKETALINPDIKFNESINRYLEGGDIMNSLVDVSDQKDITWVLYVILALSVVALIVFLIYGLFFY